jgi:Cu+-exporting ATPase
MLEIGEHFFNLHHIIPPHVSNWAQYMLATPFLQWAGWPFFGRAQSPASCNLKMSTLIATGTGVAWVYSVAATFAASLFPPAVSRRGRRRADQFRGSGGHYRGCACHVLKLFAGEHPGARSASCSIWRPLRPIASRRMGSTKWWCALRGARLRLGEKAPVDGVLPEGRSSVDEASAIRSSVERSTRRAGSLCGEDRVGPDTMLSRIVGMIASA